MPFVALQVPYMDKMRINFYNSKTLKTKFFKMLPLVILIVFSIGQLHPIYVHRRDVMFITEILSYLLNNLGAIAKIGTFVAAQDTFVKIYSKMKDIYETSNDQVKESIDVSDKKTEKMLWIYYISYIIAAGVLGIKPVIISSPAYRRHFHKYDNETTIKLAPYLNRFVRTLGEIL